VTFDPWIRMLAVICGEVALLVALRVIQQKFSLHPELARKLAHVGTGLIVLSLPHLFRSSWPVLVLCGLSFLGMLVIRTVGPLKHGLGGVLHSVTRSSGGELYFPVSVAILFVIARGNVLLFMIPILILTFADAVAALAGGRYGLTRYEGTQGMKSMEGSVAFFIVAFLSTHIPLLLMTHIGREKTLLIGLCMGLIAMLLEAIAWRGLDNLFIPLGGFILLKVYLGLGESDLFWRFCVALALVILLQIFKRHATLSTAGLLSAALFGYVAWGLGGWKWLVPPVMLFVSYPLFSPRNERNTARIHGIQAVACVVSGGALWLYLSKVMNIPEFFYPFALTFAAHLAIGGTTRLRWDYPSRSVRSVLVQSTILGWIIVFVPYCILNGFPPPTPQLCAIALLLVVMAAVIFNTLQPGMDNCPTDGPRWLRQGGIVLAVSVLAAVARYAL
jgi:phytol kinase